jgi:hypothetical protein
MNKEDQLKELARSILRDESNFHILSPQELNFLYQTKNDGECIPITYRCAMDRAKEILGEEEVTKLIRIQLNKMKTDTNL